MTLDVNSAVPGLSQVSVGGRDFFRAPRPPFLTRAVIVVDGIVYYEWTSVSVRLSCDEMPPYTFTFTCSEQEPLGNVMAALRIRPPHKCLIFLDGFQVINGFVNTRQVYYDATQHTVQIQGQDWSGRAGSSPAASQTGEFKNKDVSGIAKSVLGNIGVQT